MTDPNSRLAQPKPTARQRVTEAMVDVAAFAGAGAITYGAALIYHPAGFIVGGGFVLLGAWLTARQDPD